MNRDSCLSRQTNTAHQGSRKKLRPPVAPPAKDHPWVNNVKSPHNTTVLAENLPYTNQKKKTMDLNTTHLSDFSGEEETNTEVR